MTKLLLDQDSFSNGMKILNFIDRGDISDFSESFGLWSKFTMNPFKFFIICDDSVREKLWAEIEKLWAEIVRRSKPETKEYI